MKVFRKLLVVTIALLGVVSPCYAEKIVLEGSTTVLPIAQKVA